MPPVSSYPIFEQWYKTCDWLLQACDRMPKHTRFTISGRIANVALDITAVLVEAIYSQDKRRCSSASICCWSNCASSSGSVKTGSISPWHSMPSSPRP